MSLTRTEEIIAIYRHAEAEATGQVGRHVTLVRRSRKPRPRPCPRCPGTIAPGDWIINYGQVGGHWQWISVNCAPDDPWQTPHLKSLLPTQGAPCLACEDKIAAPPSKFCAECKYLEEGCTGPFAGDPICLEATCCGHCDEEECGERDNCTGCDKWVRGVGCCGNCDCAKELFMFNDSVCDYCEFVSNAKFYREHDARRKLEEAEKALERAKQDYEYFIQQPERSSVA
jgi:hypothetical protein